MLTTERLKLRCFSAKDIDDLYEYLSEIKINCFMEMKADSKEQCLESLKNRILNPLYMAIELKETGKVIGKIFSDSMTTNEFGGPKDTYSLCWMLNNNFQKKGYMKESAESYIKEFVSFVNDTEGNPIYENTYEYAILKKEWKNLMNNG